MNTNSHMYYEKQGKYISYRQILLENIDAVAHFLSRLIIHQGTIHPEKLYVVDVTGGTPQVRKGKPEEKRSDYSLGTGGKSPIPFRLSTRLDIFSSVFFSQE
ncbi:hypothetical protein KSX_93020 [Ktedonospora formicarum]|uniref:Uncharacterized protein n=1 Tax=Ktedonospora formicarum TaxID=2778364 RepID=A0A8J3IFX0_9CHLR|nr:hypothetical protein KSX_93020 [Ktedonospora formicarum]